MRNLCEDMGFPLTGQLPLAVDNQAAVKMSYNHGVTGRSKHFKRAFHLVREEITYQRLEVFWISTKQQLADCLTKALDPTTFTNNRAKLLSS